jgi:transmembrane 9 superfamily member 1
MWGFIGKTDKILKPGDPEYRYFVFTHSHFEVHYNGEHVIEVAISADNDKLLDVSEDLMPADAVGAMDVEFTYSVSWHETPVPYAKRLDHYEKLPRNPIHLEVCSIDAFLL